MAGQASAHTRFFAAISPMAGVWTSLELRYSRILQAGEWRNLFSRATLGWEEVSEASSEIVVEDPSFGVGRVLVPIAEGMAALRGSESGRFELDGARFRLDYLSSHFSEATSVEQRYGWTPWTIGRDGRSSNFGQGELGGIQGYALGGNGGPARELLTGEEWLRIHSLLLDGDPPFTGFADLSTAFLGFEFEQGMNHTVTFDIRAILATTFTEGGLNDMGDFVAKIRSPPTVPAAQLKVVAALWRSDGIDRVKLTCASGSVDSDGWNYSVLAVPNKGYSWFDLHLLMMGREVDLLRMRIPTRDTTNPRLQATLAFDRVGLLLNETIDRAEQVTSSDRFELLVAWVFHLCGFQTMLSDFDGLKGGDAPDLLAFDPYSSETLVIEVTARDPLNSDKLAKLRRRTDSVKSWLPGVEPRAIVVAPARDTFLALEVQEASRLSISLVARPKLWSMLEKAQENALPLDVIKEVLLR